MTVSKVLRSVLLGSISAIALHGTAFADAKLGGSLTDALENLPANNTLEIVVTFEGDDALTPAQLGGLNALGLSGMSFQALPMAGLIATSADIDAIADLDGVRSIYLNEAMVLNNGDARRLTGVERLELDGNMRTDLGLPYSGKGITVLVNDSGVDATHPDLPLFSKVLENASGHMNLSPITPGFEPISYLEGIPDTDIGSGHGTHVAGTVGGLGTQSGGEHAGVARGAGIIGYGTGAVILVLDGLGGFDYAIRNRNEHNIRVINNSFGGGGSDAPFDPDEPFAVASKIAADRGIITVFSAGNDGNGEGTIGGSYIKSPWVVAVGAGTKSGKLVDFSSRGVKGAGGTVTIDGEEFEWKDQPTIVGPGVDIVSTLANTGVLGLTDIVDTDYARMSGTSMSGPHVAGVIALMLEANPDMGWREVKSVLADTATNMPGREAWEVGAGYINAYAAVTMSAEMAEGFGQTPIVNRDFNSSLETSRLDGPTLQASFTPAGESQTQEFTVEPGLSLVVAKARISSNTAAIVLRDPNGNAYRSGISLPVLGENVAVTAPAMPGTWTVELGGIGSVSGVPLDPTGTTNGTAVPLVPSDVDISFLRIDGYSGISDVTGHAAQSFIETGVAERLLDSKPGGVYNPDAALTRADLADYLVLGGAIRQHFATDGTESFTDTAEGLATANAEAVIARGAALSNGPQDQNGVMLAAQPGTFDGDASVSRAELAYSLVQTLGLQAEAAAAAANLDNRAITVTNNGELIELEDDGDIPTEFRGYVQTALDLGLMRVSYSLEQGPFDLEPTLKAAFDPDRDVTRADYAFNAMNLFTILESED